MKKKILFLITLLLLSLTNVSAEVETYDRESISNYGVNKKWNINDNNIDNVLNTKLVDASKKIYDFSNIMDELTENTLYDKIQDFIETTGFDMVILTDRYVYSNDKDNDYFAADFYDYNDFGLNKENYDGVLIFRNTYEQDRYYNILTFGQAQLYYSYYDLEYILDEIYNYISSDDYLDGFSMFIDEMTNGYNDGIASVYKHAFIDNTGHIRYYYVPNYLIIIGGAILITIITISIMASKHKMIKKATEASDYIEEGKTNFYEKRDEFLRSHTTSYVHTSSSSGGGGGFSSTGSSGGGFSGGGGRHG